MCNASGRSRSSKPPNLASDFPTQQSAPTAPPPLPSNGLAALIAHVTTTLATALQYRHRIRGAVRMVAILAQSHRFRIREAGSTLHLRVHGVGFGERPTVC